MKGIFIAVLFCLALAVADVGHDGASMRWQKQAKSGLVLLVVTGAAIGSRELNRSNIEMTFPEIG